VAGFSNIAKITATALLAIVFAWQHAEAAEATIITLSCDGKFKIGGDQTGWSEPVTKMGLVVNLAEGTVSGFTDVVAHIDGVDAATISFSGKGEHTLHGVRTGLATVSVEGTIDRVSI
jgi:hypothetical protein